MLDAMAGPVPGDPFWAPPLPPGETFLGAADRPPGRLRVGRYLDPGMPGAELDPEVRAAVEDASGLLAGLGHEVEDLPGPPLTPGVFAAFEVVWALSATTLPVPAAQVPRLRPMTRWMRDRGLALSAKDVMEAMFTLRLFARRFVQATSGYDVLLAPVCTMPPRPLGWFDADGDPAADFERQKRYAAFPAVYNMTGQPAVSLPLWWTGEGLPVGTMLVGRPADEVTLVSLSAQLEEARPWAHRHPPAWQPAARAGDRRPR
jgi:amidase